MEEETKLAQIINDNIDPNWVLNITVGITAFLLIRILNRMDRKIDATDLRSQNHEVRITVLEKPLDRLAGNLKSR